MILPPIHQPTLGSIIACAKRHVMIFRDSVDSVLGGSHTCSKSQIIQYIMTEAVQFYECSLGTPTMID